MLKGIKERDALLVLLILTVGFFLRMAFVHEPLERDEGAYAAVAQEILRGGIPYRDAIDIKPPGLFYLYAGMIALVGPSLEGIRILTALYSAATTLAVYWFGRLSTGKSAGFWGAFLFALFSGSPHLQGSSSNAEVFMLLPLVLSGCFMLQSIGNDGAYTLMLSGLFAGAALCIKTVAAPFVLLMGVLAFVRAGSGTPLLRRVKDVVAFVFPIFVLTMATAGYFYWHGAFEDLLHWNYTYLKQYAITMSLMEHLHRFVVVGHVILIEHLLLWILSVPAIGWLLWKKRTVRESVPSLWLASSVVGVCMPGHYYAHYYIQLLPPLALLSGIGMAELVERKGCVRTIGLLVLLVGILLFAALDHRFYIFYTAEEVVKVKYGAQGIYFAEAQEIGHYVKTQTDPGDYIFQWGYEPELYFYADRSSPNRFLLAYAVVGSADPEKANEDLRLSLAAKRPKYIIIYPPFRLSLGAEHLNEILREHYHAVNTNWTTAQIYRRDMSL